MKIVINRDVGAFTLSDEAARQYLRRKGGEQPTSESVAEVSRQFAHQYAQRSDSRLVEIVERMGPYASGRNARLEVVEVPATGWHLVDVCGIEYVVSDVDLKITPTSPAR